MRPLRAARILLPLLLSCFALSAQDRDTRWRDDLDYMVGRLKAIHPNLYTKTSAEDFDRAVQELRGGIPALNDPQVLVGMSRVAAMANDSHTSLAVLSSMRRYPLTLRWFSDGLYVVVAPESQAAVVGKRVSKIAGVAPEALEAALSPYVSHDTDTWFREIGPSYMVAPDFLVAAGLLRDRLDDLPLTVEASGGLMDVQVSSAQATTVEGPYPANPQTVLYQQSQRLPYWFRVMPEQKVIYIKYNQCRQSPLLSIAEFGQAIIDAARANPPSKLVFDLRDNTGGASIWFSQLMNQFYLAYAQGVLQMPEGGVYGIISKRTFSSGTLAAVDLKRAGVILVGETTGGNPTWYGDTVTVTLPNSRLTMSISQKKVIADGFTTPIAPDIPVDFRGEDYFAERDPFLAAILNR